MPRSHFVSCLLYYFLVVANPFRVAVVRANIHYSESVASSAWPDKLPLCQELHDAIVKALGKKVSILANLKEHVEYERYHASQLLELELQNVGKQRSPYAHGLAANVGSNYATHREQLGVHQAAKASLLAHIQRLLNSSVVSGRGHINAGLDAAAGRNGGARIAAAPADIRFLSECLLTHAHDNPPAALGRYGLKRSITRVDGNSNAQPGASSHRPHRHGRLYSPYPQDHERPPLVSLMVQYFNRPWMLPVLAAPFRSCAAGYGTGDSNITGRSGSSVDQGLGFGIEMLLNVDSRVDAAAVAEFAVGPLGSGFVTLVYSNNVHEIRSYNRMAQLARGKILIMLQDDDVFPEDTVCVWLSSVVRAFRRWPRLGAVGSQRFVFDYHPNTTQEGVHFWDPEAGIVRVGRSGAGGSGAGSGEGDGDGSSSSQGAGDGQAWRRRLRTERAQPRAEEAWRRRLRSEVHQATVGAGDTAADQGEHGGDSVDRSVAEDQRNQGAGEGSGFTGEGNGSEDASNSQDGESAGTGHEEPSHEDEDQPAPYVDDGRLRMQFVSIIDYAPIAVRRSAFEAIGGIDENMSDSGQCGVHSDYDFTLRMWLAGWQVAYVEVPGLGKDPREQEGGTHRKGVSGYCWERQWEQAISYMRRRWGHHCRWDPDSYYWYGSNLFEVVAEHVRLLNLRLLQPLADPPGSYCPFGYGCGEAPVDHLTGTPRPVSPLFGNLTTWPKHASAAWAAGRARASRRGTGLASAAREVVAGAGV